MPGRALMEKRPWLLASLAAAILFYLLRETALPEPALLLLKGAGVGLLAVWALLRHAGADSRMLATVMALGALGDMAIEWDLQAGAMAFFAAHIAAIALYLRHRREVLTPSQKAAALALVVLTPVISWLLSGRADVALYGLALGGMACAAWSSSFPRYRVGTGALLFVASDLLIFARMGPLAHSPLPDLLIWPLYYFGQFLIATGIVGTLRGRAQPG
ncbi:MAG TPA: lysoplasmalogenase family protein [Novosphingobium sp.]|nr:lysoplasmalogenase family protein [Novosphingobium sp.]